MLVLSPRSQVSGLRSYQGSCEKYIQIQILPTELPEDHCTLLGRRALFMLSRYHYQFDTDSQAWVMAPQISTDYCSWTLLVI